MHITKTTDSLTHLARFAVNMSQHINPRPTVCFFIPSHFFLISAKLIELSMPNLQYRLGHQYYTPSTNKHFEPTIGWSMVANDVTVTTCPGDFDAK